MSKKLRVFATAIAALVIASGPATSPATAANKEVTLVVTQLPAQVRLIPGESINVTLSTNATTGYTWSTKVTGDKSAVKVGKGKYTAPAETGMVGVPGTTTWRITAVSAGKVVVNVIATSPGGQKSSDGKLTVIVM